MAIRGNNSLIINPYILQITSFVAWRKVGAGYPGSWESVYAAWLSDDWTYKGERENFQLHGTINNPNNQKELETIKGTLTFNPSNTFSEEEWEEITTIKLWINRGYHDARYPELEGNGGAFELVETGEIIEQIYGESYIDIPKEITSYIPFTLNINGLCRDIDDLRPVDIPDKKTYRGYYQPSVLNGMKLYCIAQ